MAIAVFLACSSSIFAQRSDSIRITDRVDGTGKTLPTALYRTVANITMTNVSGQISSFRLQVSRRGLRIVGNVVTPQGKLGTINYEIEGSLRDLASRAPVNPDLTLTTSIASDGKTMFSGITTDDQGSSTGTILIVFEKDANVGISDGVRSVGGIIGGIIAEIIKVVVNECIELANSGCGCAANVCGFHCGGSKTGPDFSVTCCGVHTDACGKK